MADNVVLNAGAGGDTIASDDIAGVKHQRVKIEYGIDGAATDVSDTNPLPVDDAGGSLTVDNATLAVVGGGVEATALRVTIASDSTGVVSIDDNGGAITVDGTVAVTGVSTAAKQDTIIGHVDGIEALLTTIDADTSNLSVVGGGTEAAAIRVTIANDSTGVLSIDDNGGVITVDGTVAVTNAGLTELAAAIDTEVQCDIVGALPAGANAIGKLAANSGVDIGDVDVLSLPASTNTLEVVGDVAHDVAVAGNPVLVCGVAQAMDDTAPPNRVSAESDATRLATDLDGAVFVHPHGPQQWSYHEDSSSALTDTSVHAAPGAGLSLYVGTIVVSTGAATALNVFFEEGASKVLGPYYLEAVAGRGLALQFNPPKKITANTALTVTTSAAIAHSIDITGTVGQG